MSRARAQRNVDARKRAELDSAASFSVAAPVGLVRAALEVSRCGGAERARGESRRDADVVYLRWLDRHERQKGEEKPIGLILCAGTKRETVEVLELEPRGIHVAEYLTELPPREVLEQRLHEAVVRTRLQLDAQGVNPSATKLAAARKKKGAK